MEREPLVLNKRSYNWITERICGVVEGRQPLICVSGQICRPLLRPGREAASGSDGILYGHAGGIRELAGAMTIAPKIFPTPTWAK